MNERNFYNVFCTINEDFYCEVPNSSSFLLNLYMTDYSRITVPELPEEILYTMKARMVNDYSINIELVEESECGHAEVYDNKNNLLFTFGGNLIGHYFVKLANNQVLNLTILPPVSCKPKMHVDIGCHVGNTDNTNSEK